jgi:hypothetical protein
MSEGAGMDDPKGVVGLRFLKTKALGSMCLFGFARKRMNTRTSAPAGANAAAIAA